MEQKLMPMSSGTYQKLEDHPLEDLNAAKATHSSHNAASPKDHSASQLHLGKPQRKKLIETTDLIALFVSLTCAALATCAILPTLPISWHLASRDQIIILGFLLGVMGQCTQTILPTAMLICEAKFGSSRLQNYEAILRARFTASHTSLSWRVVLILASALPLGLGVAYKRFLGGQTTVSMSSEAFEGLKYGLSYPPLGDLASMNNSIYAQINVNAGFYARAMNDSLAPVAKDYPVALGYNMLLLEEDSTAILDMQNQNYLTWIQARLRANESWAISASVNSIVAKRNSDLEKSVRASPSYFEIHREVEEMDSFWMYTGQDDCISTKILGKGNAYMIATHKSSWFDAVRLHYKDDGSLAFRDDFDAFRESAHIFNITRQTCTGKWRVTRDRVVLLNGSCDERSTTNVSQYLVNGGYPYGGPFSLDTLSVLVHSLPIFDIERETSPWRFPAYATATASAYWARAVKMLPPGGRDVDLFQDFPLWYDVDDEVIKSSVGTLKATWLLLIVLWVHPFIALLALLFGVLLYRVPLSQGFGIASILAGVEGESLPLLRGAALSGELEKPVSVGFQEERIRAAGEEGFGSREQLSLRYTLREHRAAIDAFDLRRKQKYW